MTRRLEVRCCCKPKKLLGWLSLPLLSEIHMTVGMKFIFHIGGGSLEPEDPLSFPDMVELTLDLFQPSGFGQSYYALKDNNVPIERLRLIHGFEENDGNHTSKRT